MKRLRLLFSIALIFAGALPLGAAPTAETLIAQARAKIGTEEKLNAVTSLFFEGKQFGADGKETGYLQLSCKASWKRKEYSLQQNGTVEFISGTDGLEGFGKVVNVVSRQGQLRVMSGGEVAAFRDLADADLRFYAVPRGGKVVYSGEKNIQGKDCHILDYHFAGGLHLRRYFDKDSLLLVAQELVPRGDNITTSLLVAEGEIIEAGIRFPKKFTIFEAGKQVGAIEYSGIVVNRDIPDSDFDFPMP